MRIAPSPGSPCGLATLSRIAGEGALLRGTVLLEPGEHARPSVLRVRRVVARPVVCVEAVLRVRVDLALAGLAGCLARSLPPLDQFWWDALILAAIKGQHRTFQLSG